MKKQGVQWGRVHLEDLPQYNLVAQEIAEKAHALKTMAAELMSLCDKYVGMKPAATDPLTMGYLEDAALCIASVMGDTTDLRTGWLNMTMPIKRGQSANKAKGASYA